MLLLPHGFEGQGPEHSSTHVERLLALAAEDNIQIVFPTTPAQYFHCLRRQAKRRWRKPLVILTHKGLLRHRQMVSPMQDLVTAAFQRMLPDEAKGSDRAPARILLCSGKVYFDLVKARSQRNRNDVAIVRVEQLYPLSDRVLHVTLDTYDADTPLYWVQEEPRNMGAYPYWRLRFGDRFLDRFKFNAVTRPESASPATGSKAAHRFEQDDLMRRAFEDVGNRVQKGQS